MAGPSSWSDDAPAVWPLFHAFAWFPEKPVGRANLNVSWGDKSVTRHEAEISTVEPGADRTLRLEEALPPVIARIAAARLISDLERNDRKGKELAICNQLPSKWTSCVAVHVRAPTEKAEDLPKVVKVPHVIAAGWQGMGTVDTARNLLAATSIEVDHRLAPVFEAPTRSNWRAASTERFAHAPKPAVAGISAGKLARKLSAMSMPPFPSIDDLVALGIPEPVAETLRQLA